MNKKYTKYYAGFWIRVVAATIDTVILMMASFAINLAMGASPLPTQTATPQPPSTNEMYSFLFSMALSLTYYTIVQSQLKGSIGKHAVGLTLVDDKTLKKISLGQSFGRYLMQFVSSICLGIGFFSVGWNDKKRGWHDRAAGTIVVKKKHLKDIRDDRKRKATIAASTTQQTPKAA